MIVLSNETVRRLLPVADTLDVVAAAWRDVASGASASAPRINLATAIAPEREYMLKRWDAIVTSRGVAGSRLTSNVMGLLDDDGRIIGRAAAPAGGFTGLIVLFELATGVPIALVHDAYLARLGAIASAALSVELLAKPGAACLAMLGAGRQARELVPLIASRRTLTEVRVYHPVLAPREQFAAALRDAGLAAIACADPELAVRGADLVATASSSPIHIFEAAWVEQGAHVCVSRPSEAPRDLRADLVISPGREPAINVATHGAGAVWAQRAASAATRDASAVFTLDQVIGGVAQRRSDREVTLYGAVAGHLPGAIFIALAAEAARRGAADGAGAELPDDWLLQDEVS